MNQLATFEQVPRTPAINTRTTPAGTVTSYQRIPVVRRSAAELPYSVFLREYVNKNVPVVVDGATSAFPAMHKWTPDFFKREFGSKQVNISYAEKMAFAPFIDAVLASREEAPGPYMYRLFIGPHLPELLPDLEPPNPYAFPRRLASPLMLRPWRRPDGYLKLLIGGTGGRFPTLHYDGQNAHAMITEIYGDKQFILYPPEDSVSLYPKPDMPNQSHITDLQHPDLTRFPRYTNATQHFTVLHPGDMIFVPSHWWHAARVLSPSVSIRQNMYDASNWRGYVDEICPPESGIRGVKRLARKAHLIGIGCLLSLLERLPRGNDTPAGLAAHVARLAPVRHTDVGDSSTWPTTNWKTN